MGVGVYVLAVFVAADLGALFVDALTFAGFFVRARFFMARNLQ
jgi:hypothetical protein